MDTSEREAERCLNRIVRDFMIEAGRPSPSRHTLLLTHDPKTVSSTDYSAMQVVSSAIFRGVRHLVESRAVIDGGRRVLRQTRPDRSIIDIACDLSDDRIYFRVGLTSPSLANA